MINTNEIVDKKFTEKEGGYDKKEVDDFLDHICDELEANEKKPETRTEASQQQQPQIVLTTSEVVFTTIGWVILFIGTLVAWTACNAIGRFDFSVCVGAFVPWLIAGIIPLGFSAILSMIRKVGNRIK